MNDIIERLNKVIDKLCVTASELAKRSDIDPSNFNKMLKGTQTITKQTLKKIADANHITLDWLLTGEGEMLNETTDIAGQNMPNGNAEQAISEYETYLLPMSVMGGSLAGLPTEGTILEQCERVISPIKGIDFAISIYGESMYPEYPSGARVLIKRVNPDIFIEWGKVYVLDTSNGVIIKEIHQSKREGFITCHSINPDPKFADFDVPMAEIYGMYRVLMCLAAK